MYLKLCYNRYSSFCDTLPEICFFDWEREDGDEQELGTIPERIKADGDGLGNTAFLAAFRKETCYE